MPNLSVKLLADLNLPDVCERCFYIKAHCRPLPWQIVAGFFSSMDSFTKRSVADALEAGEGPSWLQRDFGPLTSVPIPRRRELTRTINGITLSGIPDAIFRKADGSLLIVDYKCARWSERQRLILPKYQAQLNGYAYLLNSLDLGQVTSLALVYTEAITDFAHPNATVPRVTPTGLCMAFNANVVPVPLQPDLMPRLIARAERILGETAPAANWGCENCDSMNRVLERLRVT